MKKLLLIPVLMIFSFLAFSGPKPKHRVVVQLNSGDTLVWAATLKNLANLHQALGEGQTEIELVAHGAGIGVLIQNKSTQKAQVEALSAKGVLFKACENTIRERKIDKASLFSTAGFVPSGVAEVVLKQEQGYSYLKSGF